MSADATLDEICVVACAEAWRGDGEILASPIGVVPTIAARLAKATFEPELLLTDGEAYLVANPLPVGRTPEHKVVEGWMPYRMTFDVLWAGRRHVMMGATQIDRYGNQNIACIGDWQQPKAQLLGVRGAPGNTMNHPTSYWVPNHSKRAFVEHVDMVSGVGYRRAAEVGASASRYHDIRVVVTNKAVLDFATPDHSMRVRSVHPGVSVDEVTEATGFPLVVPDDVGESRLPTDEELRLVREVLDPSGLRRSEVK
ncbi:MAG TPA: CoA-transferase [Acidimicrobiales bacterium]|nr:CoA-transferase [Acidimicrobiales bacterium]